MHEADFDDFVKMLFAVCGVFNNAPSADNIVLWFRALEAYELPVIRAAFDAHVKDPQRGRFVPKPADLIAQIQGAAAADGRPGADEAWALAVPARDEADTVVWTAEIAAAWEIARSVLAIGDEVGARVAFREAYTRLVEGARRANVPTAWSVSEGSDRDRRERAIAAAVRAGRLPQRDLDSLAPPSRGVCIGVDGLVLLGASDVQIDELNRQKLAALRHRILNPEPPPLGPAQLEREQLLARKAAMNEKARAYLAPDAGEGRRAAT